MKRKIITEIKFDVGDNVEFIHRTTIFGEKQEPKVRIGKILEIRLVVIKYLVLQPRYYIEYYVSTSGIEVPKYCEVKEEDVIKIYKI